jgi:hypothetical protein
MILKLLITLVQYIFLINTSPTNSNKNYKYMILGLFSYKGYYSTPTESNVLYIILSHPSLVILAIKAKNPFNILLKLIT